jgi:hypothetical protein
MRRFFRRLAWLVLLLLITLAVVLSWEFLMAAAIAGWTALPSAGQQFGAWWNSQTHEIQAVLVAPPVVIIVNAIWFWMSELWRMVLHRWRAREQVYSVTLSRTANKERFDEIKKFVRDFYCLVVRYGRDDYLAAPFASEQEKYEGRLQNRVIKITADYRRDGTAVFRLNLPIHKRMGTQFKCFAVAKNETCVGNVESLLNSAVGIKDVSVGQGIQTDRVYFLVERFAIVATIDQLKNNMIYPE